MARARMGLSLKFNLFIIALVLATALGVSAFMTYRQLSEKYENLLLHGEVIAAMAAQNGEYAVYTHSEEELERQLRYLQQAPEVAYAAFLDRDLKLLAEQAYREDLKIDPPTRSSQRGMFPRLLLGSSSDRFVEVTAPIMGAAGGGENALFLDMGRQASELLGFVRIGLSLDSFRRDAARSLRLALSITLGILAVGVAITMAMTRRIISPVRRLAEAARDIAQGRLTPVEVASSGPEIRDLTEAFNAMTEKLGAYRQDVESYQIILERKAYVDELTGLANRALLKDHLKLALAQAARDKSSVALLFLDLDRFKHINDSLGHSLGDQLLKEIAERLSQCMRGGDTVARMGGDEFLIVLSNLAQGQAKQASDHVAQKIGAALTPPFDLQAHEITATFSIGVALYPQDAADSEELIKYADAAMYAAKAQGRNTYQFYRPEMGLDGIRRLTLESAMRRALERDEFELHFQPQFCQFSDRAIGAEALVRWRREDGKTISPAEFISLAEDTGLILPIGEWVLQHACRTQKEWIDQGYCGSNGFQYIAVNVSPRQFWHPSFVKRAMEVIGQFDLGDTGGLEMELTESCLMHHSGDIMHTFFKLREAGVRFAVDDFGTGYSSLSYLKKFPLDVLKIDQSFVRGCTTDPGDAAIIRAIIAMTHGLGLKVIAEGVETEEQAAFLKRHGCSLFQGYYFGRPMSKRDFEKQCLRPVVEMVD
jgi:diguanylate cyclase (GGDEF)-like protein